MYKPTEGRSFGYSETNWVCEFEDDMSKHLGIHMVELDEETTHRFIVNATSGESTLTIDEAIIDTDTVRMYLPTNSRVVVDTPARSQRRSHSRNLVASTGILSTLVLRVIDSQGSATESSAGQLASDVFEDAACLKSNLEACSYNKLKIEPYRDGDAVTNGVFELPIDLDATAEETNAISNAAFRAFEDRFGSIQDDKFGLLMFCLPPGKDPNWGAVGYVNNKLSVYSAEVCGRASWQMHEVGHNLNLDHSGEDGNEYADRTGAMGIAYKQDDTFMCYNPAKSFQLGWYEDQTKTIDPLDENNNNNNEGPLRTFVMNGVADYGQNPEALIVLRLDQIYVSHDYYIGYNRKIGINKDTGEDPNFVTITRKNKEPHQADYSWKIAKLPPGTSHVIENFDNNRNVHIHFRGVQENGRDAIIEVVDIDNCTQELCPTLEQPPCEKHIVEVKTDSYPEDTSWSLMEDGGQGRGFGTALKMTEKNHVYRTEVCLPYDTKYKFTIHDDYGDGVCCDQGDGYYKILDSQNNIVVEGGENYDKAEHFFHMGPDPNPDTDATPSPTISPTAAPVAVSVVETPEPTVAPMTTSPTMTPTNAPVTPTNAPTNKTPTAVHSCEVHTVTFVTDENPDQTSWSILKGSDEIYTSSDMTKKEAKYKTKVCLEYSTDYQFVLVDTGKDGLLGKGSYKVQNSDKKNIVKSKKKAFHIKEHTMTIGPEPNPQCKDKKGKFLLDGKKGKKRNCKQYAKKKKCDGSDYNGQPLWKACPVSCKKCDDITL